MKKILIIIGLLVCSPGLCGVFSTSGHNKSNGLNIEVYYPDGWVTEEGIRPHVVQKFKDKNNNQCALIIQDVGRVLSKKQWEQEIKQYSLADYKEMLNASNISIKQTQYEGLMGILAKYEMENERSGIKLYSVGLSHLLGYRNSMIMIQCFSADLTKQAAKKKFEIASMDFLSFGNGLVILDKYNLPEPDEQTNVDAGIIIISLLTVIFVGLIVIIKLLKRNTNTKRRK